MPEDQAGADSQFDSLAKLASPESRFDHILGYVPRVLSSKAHVIFLIGLGIYLVLLSLLGAVVSAKA